MENSQAIRWAGMYVGLWLLATAAGLVVVGVGVSLGGLAFLGLYGLTPPALRVAIYPRAGFLIAVLGVVVWQFGAAVALHRTLVSAIEAETASTLDTESLKSDILSVLDERLSEMQGELGQTRRLVDRLGHDEASSGFEFGDEIEE